MSEKPAQIKILRGCHNINTWNNPTVVRKVNLGATIPIGLPLTDSRVPEVVVLSEVAHPTVSSIKLVTYKTPAADTRSLTTGALKSKVYDKTLLDPAFWTDAKLIKAVKEAFNNAIQLGSTTATSSASVKFTGSTSDGYIIDGYYLPAIPTITTFYFK